jgi:hypothetical protein
MSLNYSQVFEVLKKPTHSEIIWLLSGFHWPVSNIGENAQ